MPDSFTVYLGHFVSSAEKCRIRCSRVLAAVALGSLMACPAFGESVSFSEGLLSVDFRNATARQAFDEIEAATGIRVDAPKDVERKRITIRLVNIDPERGVRQVLKGLAAKNHVTLYPPGGGAPTFRILVKGARIGKPVQPVVEQSRTAENSRVQPVPAEDSITPKGAQRRGNQGGNGKQGKRGNRGRGKDREL